MLPQLRAAKETQAWDYHTILNQLTRVYDSPNKVQEAEDKLFELKQGNTEAIPAYTSRFERMLYEAQGQKWSEDRKIATYRQGLIPSIRKALRSQLDPPQDYPSYARMVLRLIGTARPSVPSQNNSHLPIQARNDAMDLSVMEPRKQMARRIPASNQDEFDIGTLDICSLEPFPKPQPKPRRFFPVYEHTPPPSTDKLVSKTSYRTTGACLRCGSYDHWLSNCPRPAQPGSQSNTRSARKKVTIAEINEGSVDSFGYPIDDGSRYDSDDSAGYSID